MADELDPRRWRWRTARIYAAVLCVAALVVVLADRLGLPARLNRNPHGLAVEVLAVLLVVALALSLRVAREGRLDLRQQQIVSEQFREAETRFRNLVENIPAVTHISGLDDTASTIYISPQVEGMLGYTPQEWRRDPDLWVKMLHPDDRERMMANNAYHVVTGSPLSGEYRMLAKDGRVVWVREDAVVIRDERGEPKFSQGVWLDVTERKQA